MNNKTLEALRRLILVLALVWVVVQACIAFYSFGVLAHRPPLRVNSSGFIEATPPLVDPLSGQPTDPATAALGWFFGRAAWALLYFPARWILDAFQDHEEKPHQHSGAFKPNHIAPLVIFVALILLLIFLVATNGASLALGEPPSKTQSSTAPNQ